jgi:uncharacterized protein YyaL (SSP411 family)
MLVVRQRRKQPMTDDKVLASWNGLMIAGLARAGRTLDEPRYTNAAATAAAYILEHMRSTDGGLYRTMRKGKTKIPAFLDDYSFLVHGLLELHRSDRDARWLDAAKQLMNKAATNFGSERGGYYDTLEGQADLFVRTRSTSDGAIPSGNSQMVHNLVDLYDLTGEQSYLDQANKNLRSFAIPLQQRGPGMIHMVHALLRTRSAKPQAAVAQTKDGAPGEVFDPVTISVAPKQIDLSKGKTKLSVTLHVEESYHLNAHEMSSQGLVPTKLVLHDGDGLQFAVKYPSALSKQYPFADEPIKVYEGKVVIEATIHKIGDAKAQPNLRLTYQACTDNACLAPKTIRLPVEISVGP